MPFFDFLITAFCFLLITKGADWFIESSVKIAELTATPKLIIGAVLIGLFTNFPEFVVAIVAAIKNYPTIALGNATGSIAFNTGIILGVATFVLPVTIDQKLLKQQGTIMFVTGICLYIMAFFGNLNSVAGLLLVSGMVGFIWYSVAVANGRNTGAKKTDIRQTNPWLSQTDPGTQAASMQTAHYDLLAKSGVQFLIGGLMVIIGAHFLVQSAVNIAHYYSVPEIVIATTLVAGGTSLPELAAVLSALVKGHSDLSLGTIVGSNTLNMLGTVGLGALFRTIPITQQNLMLDLPVMLLFLYLILFWGLRKNHYGKKNGVALMGCYAVYFYILLFSYSAFSR